MHRLDSSPIVDLGSMMANTNKRKELSLGKKTHWMNLFSQSVLTDENTALHFRPLVAQYSVHARNWSHDFKLVSDLAESLPTATSRSDM